MNSFRSIKISLILPYALLVIVASLVLSTTYYWSASHSVKEFSQRYIQEVTTRISQSVHARLDNSKSVLEAAFPRYMRADADLSSHIEALRTRFWIATSISNSTNTYVYYANESGQSFALKRLGKKQAELRVKLAAAQQRIYYRYRGILGPPRIFKTEQSVFGPHRRLWYQLAGQADNAIWTSIYADYVTGNLVVTRARRVLLESGELAGVVATDVSLRSINNFLSTLRVAEHTRAFIVDDYGQLIAAPKVFNTASGVTGKISRVAAVDSGDPIIAAAYAGLAPLLAAAPLDQSPVDNQRYQTVAIDQQGRTIVVVAQRIVDGTGMDWLAVVAIPRNAVFVDINRQFWIALGIGIVAVLLAIGLGVLIFGRIARDIESLSDAVSRVRDGGVDMTFDIQRHDEVGDLARNFKEMHRNLFADDLTGVASRTALDNLLDSITRSPSGQPFTLFFTDLDHFKPLNDRYGHHNGDRALIEIAQRLRDCTRPDDFIARLGGDEFVIIAMGETTSDGVDGMLTKLKTAMEMPLEELKDIPIGEVVSVGVAIGYAIWPKDASSPDDLIKCADTHMYRHKRKER